ISASFLLATPVEEFFEATPNQHEPSLSQEGQATLSHPYLPFGTLVEVTWLRTGNQTVAEVQSRTLEKTPIVALSRDTYLELGAPIDETIEVSISPYLQSPIPLQPIVPAPTIPVSGHRSMEEAPLQDSPPLPCLLQFGAFQDPQYAKSFQKELSRRGIQTIIRRSSMSPLHRVLSEDEFRTQRDATFAANELVDSGKVDEVLVVQ
ncbi:MAG: SPOR domain-containing protein, partial [Verrucomicrobiota bacterium]